MVTWVQEQVRVPITDPKVPVGATSVRSVPHLAQPPAGTGTGEFAGAGLVQVPQHSH